MFEKLPNCKKFICAYEMTDAAGVCGLLGEICSYKKRAGGKEKNGTCKACENGNLEAYEREAAEQKHYCYLCRERNTCKDFS